MEKARTEDVKRLYETYPYPYSVGHTEPDFVLVYVFRGLFALEPLTGWHIFDAGCGTGHKLTGLALTYPTARFVGTDLSSASVAVARTLQQKYRISNMQVTQGDVLTLSPDKKYDVVLALGVVHHLEHPERGLTNLSRFLKPDGLLAVWLYHSLGEFERLTHRELLVTLWGGNWDAMREGQELMEQLGLGLESYHYGPREKDANTLEANADAFMHPIVNAYRFAEAFDMLRAAGMEWVVLDFVNVHGAVKLVDRLETPNPNSNLDRFFIRSDELFSSQSVRDRYRALPPVDQLKVIELAVRPRGFHVVAGRGESYRKLTPRLRDNAMSLLDPPRSARSAVTA